MVYRGYVRITIKNFKECIGRLIDDITCPAELVGSCIQEDYDYDTGFTQHGFFNVQFEKLEIPDYCIQIKSIEDSIAQHLFNEIPTCVSDIHVVTYSSEGETVYNG